MAYRSLILWQRAATQGFLHVIREKNWLLPVSALSGIFLLVQLFCIGFISLQAFSMVLKEGTSVRLEMQNSADNEKIIEFITGLLTLEFIEKVERITPEKSYQVMKEKDPTLIAFLEEFNFPNPFPETVQVTLTHIDRFNELEAFLQQDTWRTILDPNFNTINEEQKNYIAQVLTVTSAITHVLFIFIGIGAFILLYIVIEIIRTRMFKRSEEILIKRLCGAMHFYIILPFIIETSILLLSALCISYICTTIIILIAPYIAPTIGSSGALGSIWMHSQNLLYIYIPYIILCQIVTVAVISWIGTWIGSYKIMHTRNMGLERQ